MTNNVLLDDYLRRLKLPTMAAQYAALCNEATKNKVSHEEFLCSLAELEIRAREDNAQKRRLRTANFPAMKTLDTFDFAAAPWLNKSLVLELHKGSFLNTGDNVILLGSIGTGKTHLATAIGVEACRLGKRVRFCSVAGLINELIEAQEHKRLSRLQQSLARLGLLILDELGMVPYDRDGANMLFQVISARHELKPTMITTNLEFKDWTQVFGSQQLTTAVLDRLTHRCHIVEMNGESYRFKESLRKRKPKDVA